MVAIVGLVLIQAALMFSTSRLWGDPPTLTRVMGATFAGIAAAVAAAIIWGNLVTIPQTNSAFLAQTLPLMAFSASLVSRGKSAVTKAAATT